MNNNGKTLKGTTPLDCSPLFEGCSEKTVMQALNSPLLDHRYYEKGDRVYFKGGALGILVKGRMKVGGRGDLKKLVINQFESGAAFGFASLFEKGDHFETDIRAVSDAEVFFIPEELVEQLIDSDGRFARNIIAIQSSKIRFLNSKIYSFTAPTGSEKLLRYLSTLPVNEDEGVVLPMGMSALAARLDMGRASLYRAFSSLEEEGKIVKKGDCIVLK